MRAELEKLNDELKTELNMCDGTNATTRARRTVLRRVVSSLDRILGD